VIATPDRSCNGAWPLATGPTDHHVARRLQGTNCPCACSVGFTHTPNDVSDPGLDRCRSRVGASRYRHVQTYSVARRSAAIHPNLAHRHRLFGHGLADTSLVGTATKTAPTDERINVASRRLRQNCSKLFMGIPPVTGFLAAVQADGQLRQPVWVSGRYRRHPQVGRNEQRQRQRADVTFTHRCSAPRGLDTHRRRPRSRESVCRWNSA